jgi:hypothetical protein
MDIRLTQCSIMARQVLFHTRTGNLVGFQFATTGNLCRRVDECNKDGLNLAVMKCDLILIACFHIFSKIYGYYRMLATVH